MAHQGLHPLVPHVVLLLTYSHMFSMGHFSVSRCMWLLVGCEKSWIVEMITCATSPRSKVHAQLWSRICRFVRQCAGRRRQSLGRR